VPTFRTARVAEILTERDGLQRVRVGWPDATPTGDQAYVLTDLTGPVTTGDEVVVNTTAVDLGLGTGGWHVVHWNLSRREWSRPGGGHVMKLRYTSLQIDTGAVEEHQPEAIDEVALDLEALPVVVVSVHSQMAAVAAAIREVAPARRVVVVMTDEAALPAALSDLLADLVQRGWISAVVTCGHAFGGDLEAVGPASALAAAKAVAEADVVLMGPGPGVVGTGTTTGHSGMAAVAHVDLASALGAKGILAVRASSGDLRSRHQGLSHHSRAALALVARPVTVAVPRGEARLRAAVVAVASPAVRVIEVDVPDVVSAMHQAHVPVTTMGRAPEEDRLFFNAAAAAGVAAIT
jgi:hypothetical protein